MRCRHATLVDEREFEFTRVLLLLKLRICCGRTDPFVTLWNVVVNFCFHQHDELDGKVSALFEHVSVSSQTSCFFALVLPARYFGNPRRFRKHFCEDPLASDLARLNISEVSGNCLVAGCEVCHFVGYSARPSRRGSGRAAFPWWQRTHEASVKLPNKELMALAEALLVLSRHREQSRSQDATMGIPSLGEFFSLLIVD